MKLCGVADCEHPYRARGMCSKHYSEQWRVQNPGASADRYAAKRDEIRAQQRGYYEANRESIRRANDLWKAANPDRHKAIESARRAARADERRAQDAATYAAKREERKAQAAAWYAANRDRARDNFKAWSAANPDRVRESHAKRRAAKAGAPGTFTAGDWRRILAEFDHACAYCSARGIPLEQEHVTPLSRGGLHDRVNIVPACRGCNGRKGTRTLLEFVALPAVEAIR